MKKILALFLVVATLIAAGCLRSVQGRQLFSADNSTPPTPLLYKITDDDGSIIWLLGSIHVGRDDFYPLPDYIMNPLKNSAALAVEVNVIDFENDSDAKDSALKQLEYADGSEITNHIDETLYEEASEIVSQIGSASRFDRYQPALWANIIDNILYKKLDIDSSLGVNRHLLSYAADNDIMIYEIESADVQYGMLASFSPELQEYLLTLSINKYNDMDAIEAELNALIDSWYKGDKALLVEKTSTISANSSPEVQSLYEEYIDKMLTKRNIIMTDFAENALKNNEEIFICVGAAHVVGENSITDLLTEKGYKVEVITNA